MIKLPLHRQSCWAPGRSAGCWQVLWIMALMCMTSLTPVSTVWAQVTLMPSSAVGEIQTADDTLAIQAAVDRGSVEFAPGVYRITKTIDVVLNKTGFASLTGHGTTRIIMAGSGPAFRFKGTHAGTADPESVKPVVWDRERMPTVSRLEIVGDNPEADGIEAAGTMQMTLSNLLIRRVRHGIHLVERNRNVIVHDCQIYENSGIGIFYDRVDLHQSNILGSHISYNRGGGIVSRGGAVRNLHIGTCDIEANMAVGQPPAANVMIDCSEGSTAEVTITGCTLQHGAEAAGSANIVFIGGAGAQGVDQPAAANSKAEPTRWGHLTVTGNVLTDTRLNMHLKHVRGATITGNTFGQGLERNLLIEHSSSISIGLNTFDRNPRYYQGKLASQSLDAIELDHSSDCTFQGNTIVGGRSPRGALVLTKCESINVSGCTILDSDGPGVLFKDCRASMVSGCIVNDRRPDAKSRSMVTFEGGSGNLQHQNLMPSAIPSP